MNTVPTTDTPLQLSFNEVCGKFDGDKEQIFDILDEFVHYWVLEGHGLGLTEEEIAKGLHLYYFFNRVLRLMEISFEGEIE